AAGQTNNGGYNWYVDPAIYPLSTQYQIRVRSSLLPAVADTSDAVFEVSPAVSQFYVNDGSVAGGEDTNARRYDHNDCLSPATPKASIRALLQAYDLDPGEFIYVDTGVYSVTANIVIGTQDAGVTIRGPVGVGHTALLNRGNTAAGAYVFELVNADGVTLSG